MELTGSSALVTGGASGLGLATARRLAASGVTVTIVDLPTSAGADIATELGGTFAPADVTDPVQVAEAVATAAAAGPLRVVVNCAGIAPPAKVLDREGNPGSLADFERLVRINLVGTYNVISQAAAAMARTEEVETGGRGVIVSTASVAAFDGQIGQPAYSASKGGVHAMTLPIARELARYGIRVLTIAPGIMETPMLKGLPQAAQDSLGEQVPYPQRLGRPDEYAQLVMAIVGNDYLNGETIRLDGAIPDGTAMNDSILFTRDGGLARVTFNRPASLNAMDFEMGERWRSIALETTSDPSVGAVILDAAGPSFCAGGDVVAMATSGATGADVTAAAHVIHEGIRTFALSDKPIVAAVNGAVAGGGLGLMLTADYIVAGDSAKFVSKYANIGLTPDLGVSTLLPAAIGQRRALQLLLQDRTLTALDWGLVAEVLPAAEVAARVDEIAAFWFSNATGAFGQAERLVRTGADRTFDENLDDEAASIGARFDTDESQARVAAFAAASRKHAKETS